ncbi:MAG: D-alanine--D-alanine ligase [Clostridia bacterium]|nr:D-alanine--D-alanine ligase [Clostridia bacterium]
MDKKTVLLLFGGISTEHEVSCVSAATVAENISRERYRLITVGITCDGRWLLWEGGSDGMRDRSWEKAEGLASACLLPDAGHKSLCIFREGGVELCRVDCVFPVLHGIGGEDGTVQGLCRLAGIPCVGCGVAASAVCMDKAITKAVAAQAGLSQARWIVAEPGAAAEETAARVEAAFAYPVFVKPANAGSSVGISKVRTREELPDALSVAAAVDPKVVIEEMVVGQEVEVAVLGNREPMASIVGEVAAVDGFYSYSGKYLDNTSGIFIPARLPAEWAERVRTEAIRAYRALDCRGFSRADFFVTAEGKVIFNEINTIPGFTSISMYPKLMEASGIPCGELVDRLIALACEAEGGANG